VWYFRDTKTISAITNKTVDKNLEKVIQICHELSELADHGDRFRQDIRCGVVYGALRDAAYKVRKLAEKELAQHNSKLKAPSRET